MKNFKDLDLDPALLQAISESGYETPTPIQEQAIPKILEGFDIRGSAQTGTGKTAAFILPALQRLIKPSTPGKGPRVLVLVPTRELAMQVSSQAIKYSKYMKRITTVCIYGGVPYPLQRKQLSRPYEILVATPGRLIDHLEQGRINLSRVELFVLDEADRMLDMGFIEPVEAIAEELPSSRQTLLFSATLKGNVINLSRNLLKNPLEITIAPEITKQEKIEQRLHYVDDLDHKNRLLNHLLNDESLKQGIVFTATKSYADELVENLRDSGHEAAALHGDMNQNQRTRTLGRLRQGKLRILVATDVAARGIDVLTLTHVINFDLPSSAEDYVHRIGRTGRAGAEGIAISFASGKDRHLVKRIEQFTGQPLTPSTIPGLEPRANPSFRSKSRRRNGPPGRARFAPKNFSKKGRNKSFFKR